MEKLKQPNIASNVYLAKGSIVRGDVTLAQDCSVWFNAVIRAEAAPVTVGANTNIQDNCVIHVDFGTEVRIGENVTIGHGAIVHGCTIGDNTLVGMGAIILNHASIGKNCIIGAGALVTQNAIIPDNSLVLGSPGKVVRTVTTEEAESNRKNADYYAKEAAMYAALE